MNNLSIGATASYYPARRPLCLALFFGRATLRQATLSAHIFPGRFHLEYAHPSGAIWVKGDTIPAVHAVTGMTTQTPVTGAISG